MIVTYRVQGSVRADNLPSTLLTLDTETAWQQLAYRSEQVAADAKKVIFDP